MLRFRQYVRRRGKFRLENGTILTKWDRHTYQGEDSKCKQYIRSTVKEYQSLINTHKGTSIQSIS